MHLTFLEEAEVAAVRRAARILRLLTRQLREVGAAAQLSGDLLRLGPRLELLRSTGALRHGDQNVACVQALALLEFVCVLFVERFDVGVHHGDLGGHFGVDHFGDLEAHPRLIAQLIDRNSLARERLLKRLLGGEPAFDHIHLRRHVLVARIKMTHVRFLRQHVIRNELIEQPAHDLVAPIGRDWAACARLHAVRRVLELPSFHLLAVHRGEHRRKLGGKRLRGGGWRRDGAGSTCRRERVGR